MSMTQNISENNHVFHTFEPIYNAESKILILGTIPSPKSREIGFYYSHPQNRFWKAVSAVLCQEAPETLDDKKRFLLNNKIAIWDVLASCSIKNADDNSIQNPIANDFSHIFETAHIKAVFTTGKKATMLYQKLCPDQMAPIYLPSPSPANCAISFEKLKDEYSVILNYL